MFDKQLQAISTILDAKFRGMSRKGQNSADRGELCEVFVREFLEECLPDNYCVFRGGKIINVRNEESAQIDLILTGKGFIKLFADKGVYPIESVAAAFAITSRLDLRKLKGDVDVLRTIPKSGVSMGFKYDKAPKEKLEFFNKWMNAVPYKCIFGFGGTISADWSEYLRQLVKQGVPKSELPDLVAVNQVGFITKIRDKWMPSKTGENPPQHFCFFDLRNYPKKFRSFRLFSGSGSRR